MKKLCVFACAVLLPCLLAGCVRTAPRPTPAEPPPAPVATPPDTAGWGAMEYFSYDYGGYPDESWHFEIAEEDGGLYLEVEGRNGPEVDERKAVDPAVLRELKTLIEEHEIALWDGFDESEEDEMVMDGYSFRLHMVFENHEFLAGGRLREPDNYWEGHGALETYLKKLAGVGE